MFGVDYATVTPSPEKLVQNNVGFVCRYLSGYSKDLTVQEAQALRAAGLQIVTVWETDGRSPLLGRTVGISDATRAAWLGEKCGMPAGSPIYFAIDFDATPGQQAAINAYFTGVAQVIGRNRTGAYGGYWPIKRLFDAGLIAYGWQTYAWSGGQWDSRAQIHQYDNSNHSIGGLSVDYDQAMAADFGQWRLPLPAPQVKPDPHPEPKNNPPFINAVWPNPIPSWFWAYAQWRIDGESYQRPWDAPAVIPPWAWLRLQLLLHGS